MTWPRPHDSQFPTPRSQEQPHLHHGGGLSYPLANVSYQQPGNDFRHHVDRICNSFSGRGPHLYGNCPQQHYTSKGPSLQQGHGSDRQGHGFQHYHGNVAHIPLDTGANHQQQLHPLVHAVSGAVNGDREREGARQTGQAPLYGPLPLVCEYPTCPCHDSARRSAFVSSLCTNKNSLSLEHSHSGPEARQQCQQYGPNILQEQLYNIRPHRENGVVRRGTRQEKQPQQCDQQQVPGKQHFSHHERQVQPGRHRHVGDLRQESLWETERQPSHQQPPRFQPHPPPPGHQTPPPGEKDIGESHGPRQNRLQGDNHPCRPNRLPQPACGSNSVPRSFQPSLSQHQALWPHPSKLRQGPSLGLQGVQHSLAQTQVQTSQHQHRLLMHPQGQYQPSALQQQPSGLQQQPSGLQQQPSGLQQQPSGLQQQPSGLQQQPSGLQQQPSGLQQQPSGLQQQPSGLQQQPSGPQHLPSGLQQQPSGLQQQPSKLQQQPSGLQQQPSGLQQQPSGLQRQPSGLQQQEVQVQQYPVLHSLDRNQSTQSQFTEARRVATEIFQALLRGTGAQDRPQLLTTERHTRQEARRRTKNAALNEPLPQGLPGFSNVHGKSTDGYQPVTGEVNREQTTHAAVSREQSAIPDNPPINCEQPARASINHDEPTNVHHRYADSVSQSDLASAVDAIVPSNVCNELSEFPNMCAMKRECGDFCVKQEHAARDDVQAMLRAYTSDELDGEQGCLPASPGLAGCGREYRKRRTEELGPAEQSAQPSPPKLTRHSPKSENPDFEPSDIPELNTWKTTDHETSGIPKHVPLPEVHTIGRDDPKADEQTMQEMSCQPASNPHRDHNQDVVLVDVKTEIDNDCDDDELIIDLSDEEATNVSSDESASSKGFIISKIVSISVSQFTEGIFETEDSRRSFRDDETDCGYPSNNSTPVLAENVISSAIAHRIPEGQQELGGENASQGDYLPTDSTLQQSLVEEREQRCSLNQNSVPYAVVNRLRSANTELGRELTPSPHSSSNPEPVSGPQHASYDQRFPSLCQSCCFGCSGEVCGDGGENGRCGVLNSSFREQDAAFWEHVMRNEGDTALWLRSLRGKSDSLNSPLNARISTVGQRRQVYACAECHATFRLRDECKLHVLQRHTTGTRSYVCSACHVVYCNMAAFKQHKRIRAQNDLAHGCDYISCSSSFSSVCGLNRHYLAARHLRTNL